jgi:hypothetical protein
MNSKKLVSAVLTATTILSMAGFAALPVLANAQTTTSLQTQIAALLAQIQTLQGQLNASGSTTTTSSGANTYNFTSDLTVGSTGSAVTALQQFLIGQGDLVLATPTQYFGALTQKALAKFQAAKGISPAVGYFGPKTRAFVNSMSTTSSTTTTTTTTTTSGSLPAGCTTSTGYSSTTGASCATGTTSVVAPSTGLAVSLASDNPQAGSLVSSAGTGGGSAARIPVLSFNLTAGNSGAVTVSQLVFQKNGVISDSAIANAYLVQNGQVVAQYSSLNSGVLTFSGLGLSIPAGQSEEFQLAVGLSSGSVNAGNTTSFSLPSATDVTAFGSNNAAVTPSGSFPLSGNVFTVTTVGNPQLATLTVGSSSIGTTVTAGTQGNIVGSYTFNVGINPVYLENLNFHVIGSANMANIQNVKLLVNGTQVGNTLTSVPANGMADFVASSTNIKLNTGNNNVQVVADIMGSPNMDFQFEILNSYDVLAVDSQYNVPITVQNNGGTDQSENVTIQPGQITLSQDSNTPTGNISNGMSNTVLAKYDLYAAGEPVKVQWLDFQIVLATPVASTALSNELQSVSLTDDAGNQVGTTITTPPSGNSCQESGEGYATTTVNSQVVGTYNDCFGTPGSPINYIVPANTTRVLSLKANIQPNADFSAITANLRGNSNNLQGQISSHTTGTSGVNGVTLTRVSSSLTPAVNNALGSQAVSAGTSNLRIGSYALSASSAEGVNINTVSIQLTPASTSWIGGSNDVAFQNLKLFVNGTQFGTTQSQLAPGSTYVFSGSAINVPAGQTVNVDVYADSLSNATGTYQYATALTGYTGSGIVSYDSVTDTQGTISGQQISFSGQPALSVGIDSSNPPSGVIAQSATGNTLGVYRFSETSNVEAVKVTQLNVVETVSSSSSNFSNLQLYNGSTLLGTANAPTLSSVGQASGTWTYAFNSFANALVIPQGNSVSLTLKGDAGSYTGGSMADNSSSTFSIATSSIVARGNTSNKTALVSGSATSSPMTVLRSIETVTGSPVTSLPPASLQQIGSITFTSNAAGDTVLNTLKLTFNSTASSSAFITSVALHDPNGNNVSSSLGTAVVATPGATPSVLWTFTAPHNAPVVTAGSSYTLTVWGDLSQIAAIGNTSQSLNATISSNTDYSYLDGTNNAPSTVYLPTNVVPITIVSMTTPVGGQF